MEINKTKECKICGWKGRTHLHHIIPLRDLGEDIPRNIIELCPNHHSEACENEKDFAKKYNLVGEGYSQEKQEALKEGSFLFFNFCYDLLSKEDSIKFEEIVEKYNFTKFDFVGYLLGVSGRTIEQTYLNIL